MSKNIKAVRGTRDWLGDDYLKFEQIINHCQRVASNYGCVNCYTPIIEYAETFIKSMGETSDVVGKEMYQLHDKSGDLLTLRPEFTAAIARAFYSNGWQQHLPLKLFSAGPVFRYERPQRGRLRQFHQINVEYLGFDQPQYDAEIICLAEQILNIFNHDTDNLFYLEINSLGNNESRLKYRKKLLEYLQDYKNLLSEDSKNRLELNPLRILDSKAEEDINIVKNAPDLKDYFDQESKDYFATVIELLTNLGIEFIINDKLVRGLDYYQHTIFEFKSNELGAQSTVLAGGRYDGLYKQMGSVQVPAIGFAMGVERLYEIFHSNIKSHKNDLIIIATLGDEAEHYALQLAKILREADLKLEVPFYKKSLNKKLQYANKIKARFALIIGEEEIKNHNCKIKDLINNTEITIDNSKIIDYLKGN